MEPNSGVPLQDSRLQGATHMACNTETQLILKPATPLFYDAPHKNLDPINLKPYAFTTNHAMNER